MWPVGGAPGSNSRTGMVPVRGLWLGEHRRRVSVTLGDRSDDFLHSCVFLDNPLPKDTGPSGDAQTGMDGYQDWRLAAWVPSSERMDEKPDCFGHLPWFYSLILVLQTPVLPPTITDQIRLWELERDRLRFTEGEWLLLTQPAELAISP